MPWWIWLILALFMGRRLLPDSPAQPFMESVP